jgi:hypothetical protein
MLSEREQRNFDFRRRIGWVWVFSTHHQLTRPRHTHTHHYDNWFSFVHFAGNFTTETDFQATFSKEQVVGIL